MARLNCGTTEPRFGALSVVEEANPGKLNCEPKEMVAMLAPAEAGPDEIHLFRRDLVPLLDRLCRGRLREYWSRPPLRWPL